MSNPPVPLESLFQKPSDLPAKDESGLEPPVDLRSLFGPKVPDLHETADTLIQNVRDATAVGIPQREPSDVYSNITPYTDKAPRPRLGENMATMRVRQAREHAASPEGIAETMRSLEQTIGPSPTGFAKLRQNLASTRLFTDRSLVEFDLGNSSGFHIGGVLAHPVETSKQLVLGIPKFFAHLVTQPAELVLNQLAKGTVNEFLLPEEEYQIQKETLANYAMLLVGPAMGTVSRELRAGRDILRSGIESAQKAGVPVELSELNALRQTLPRALQVEEGLPGKIITGIHEGVAAGVTGGAILGNTPEEKRNLMAAYAISALPLGIAFEAARTALKPEGTLGPVAGAAVKAQELYMLRMMQASEARTLQQNSTTFYNLATQDNLLSAAVRAGYELGGAVIPAVKDLKSIPFHQHGPEPIVHRRPDGLYDVALGIPGDIVREGPGIGTGPIGEAPKAQPETPTGPAADIQSHGVTRTQATAMFQVAGHFPDEHVSFLGRTYTYERPVIGKNGELEGHVIKYADGTEFEVPWDQVRRGADLQINQYEASPLSVRRAIFSDFKKVIATMAPEGKGIPNASFSDMIERYVATRHLPAGEVGPITHFLGERLADQLRSDHLTPEEHIAFKRMVAESKRYSSETAAQLADVAASNGMLVERNNGGLLISDGATGEMLGQFYSPEAAKQFINTSGQGNGPDLTPRGPVPPDAINRGLMAVPPPPNGPHTAPFGFLKDGPLAQLSNWFNTTLLGTRFTGMQQIMKSLDSQALFKDPAARSEFYARVADPLQKAFKQKFAAMYGDMKRASATAKAARGLTPDELSQVTTSLQTMSPDEMVKPGGLFNRSFTDQEIASAQWFVDNGINMRKAYRYRQDLLKVQRKYAGRPAEMANQIKKLQINLNVDEAHVEAARVIGELRNMNKPGEMSLYGVVRLADAIMRGDQGREKFMTTTNFTPQQRALHEQIASHLRDADEKFNIPDERRLQGYFAHLKTMKEDEVVMDAKGTPTFASDLLKKDEELSEFDHDPINILVRYLNLGFNDKYTKVAVRDAQRYIYDTTKEMETGGRYVRDLLTNYYVNELRGIPHESSKFMQSMFNGVMDRLGMKVPLDVRKDMVNTFLSLGSSAMVGFRPMQGIRDFHNAVSIYYTRFGAERTAAMLTAISRVTPEELVQAGILKSTTGKEGVGAAFEREGLTARFGPISVLTPQERLANTLSARSAPLREAIQNTAELGIKWGLQHNVYQWLHSGVMLESTTRTLRELNKLATAQYGMGESAKTKAYDNLFINSYDLPVAKEFDRLVTEGNFKEAAEFLARATSFETVSTFGLANHPAGWGTNTGRLFGQFGNWPIWARSTLARLATRGTTGERTRVAVRFGLTQGSLALASAAFGLNLNSWYLPTAAPVVSAGAHLAAAADSFDEDQTKEMQKAAAVIALGVPGSLLFRGGPALGVAQTAIQLGSGNPLAETEAMRSATQVPLTGVPGSFLFRDILRGVAMAQNGDNPVSAWLQAFGVQSTGNESLLNEAGTDRPVISDIEF